MQAAPHSSDAGGPRWRGSLPRRFRSSALRACGAGRLAIGFAGAARSVVDGDTPLPAHDPVVASSTRRLELSTIPVHDRDAVLLTDGGALHQLRVLVVVISMSALDRVCSIAERIRTRCRAIFAASTMNTGLWQRRAQISHFSKAVTASWSLI